MEIQSAFNAGVQGFQKASESASKAAENIATSVSENPDYYGLDQDSDQDNENTTTSLAANGENNTVSLTQSVVDLRVAEFQAKASAEVVESADENLGTLLDVRV